MQKIEEDEKEALTDKRVEEDKIDIVDTNKKKKKKAKKKKDKRKKNDDIDEEEKESEKDSKKKSSVNSEMFNIGTYSLIKMLGSGSFGEIHLAYDSSTRQLRAIKFELASQKNPQLKHEYNILEHINKSESGNVSEGVPKVYGYDRVENKCNYMIMDFLGPSLADLFQFRNKNFSLKSVCLLGIQMLSRIEFLHEKGFIHRDIKPENFVIGLNEKSSTVYVIDFGLAKRYKDKNTGQHIPYRENRHLIGTARYASLNAHLGIEQSRRDDIESIGYVIVYFLAGRLPWQSKNDKAKSPAKIMEKKLVTPPEILCKKQMELAYYFHYCKNLKFEDRPDYNSLKGLLFDIIMSKETISSSPPEFMFDWFIDDENPEDNNINNENQLEKRALTEKEKEKEKEKDNIEENREEDYNNYANYENEEKIDLIDLSKKDFLSNNEGDSSPKNFFNSPHTLTNQNSLKPQKENFSFDRDLFLSNHVKTEKTSKTEPEVKKPKDSQKQITIKNKATEKNQHKENDNWSEKSSARDTEREVNKKDNEHVKTLLQASDSNKNSDSQYKLLDSSEKSSEERRKLNSMKENIDDEIVLKPKSKDILLDVDKKK